jgi:putative endonuclease
MVDARKIFGSHEEARAADHLVSIGYQILARQYRSRVGEIDLVARDGDEVVFVEVKARRSNAYGYPEESVTESKLQKILRMGEYFLREHKCTEAPFRIDVIAIEGQGYQAKLTHLKRVW